MRALPSASDFSVTKDGSLIKGVATRISPSLSGLPRWPGDVAGGTPNVGLNEVNRFLILASGILTEYLSRAAPISAKPNIPRDRASKSSPPTNAGL
jgi:hypothetical protein